MHVETKTNVLLLFWTFFVTRRRNRANDIPSTRHGLCVRHECDLCHIFLYSNCLSIIVKSMKSTYGIYCNIISLETCKEICICTKTWLRKRSECTSYSATEFHCIIFDIDQDVILTSQIIKYTSVIVYCRNLIDRNKWLHKKIINYI
jgi:hypothetical protein